jgi:hypothetical protein
MVGLLIVGLIKKLNKQTKLFRKLKRAIRKPDPWADFWEDILDKIYYEPISKYNQYCEMLNRMFYWGWYMRWSYDFDAQTMYEMLYRKLDRVYCCMRDHSHLMWNSNEDNRLMRELREARELAYRMWHDEYDMKAFYEMEEKFGKLETWSEPAEYSEKFGQLYRWRSLWGGSQEKDEAARPIYARRNEHWRKVKEFHKKRLFHLLDKNIEAWWD